MYAPQPRCAIVACRGLDAAAVQVVSACTQFTIKSCSIVPHSNVGCVDEHRFVMVQPLDGWDLRGTISPEAALFCTLWFQLLTRQTAVSCRTVPHRQHGLRGCADFLHGACTTALLCQQCMQWEGKRGDAGCRLLSINAQINVHRKPWEIC